ncbi:hypothetical protein ACQ86N_24095 [Puia sp. P3]|uniref:hypothetical protein n=1 Tax=Puia sp. P3 TaxID=3423952 RepID=UPI003D67DB68
MSLRVSSSKLPVKLWSISSKEEGGSQVSDSPLITRMGVLSWAMAPRRCCNSS